MDKASPSTCAYQDSAGFRNEEPARVIFEPSLQNPVSIWLQLQCFCERKKAILVLDSGRKQVSRLGSNISILLRITLMTSSLDRLKASSCLSVHKNVFFGLWSSLNGAITWYS